VSRTTSRSGGNGGADRDRTSEAMDTERVVSVLNRILEQELAGVVRYTHYSLLIFGFGRIPIVSWLRTQADEALLHAQTAGEWITSLGAYPSLEIGPLLDSHTFDMATILRESLEAEASTLDLYQELRLLVEGRSIPLEEYARQMIQAEEMHASEVDKMLRRPGELGITPR
jgi:bacterioferritin